jgi:hypothetical protein
MQRNQPMQMITLDDLGRINARILCNPQQFAGKVLEISSQTLTGRIWSVLSNAAGFPIHYRRFPDAVNTKQLPSSAYRTGRQWHCRGRC